MKYVICNFPSICNLCFIFLRSTILAIAGEDFSVIASDTRLSEGFQIYTRDSPKTYQLYVACS